MATCTDINGSSGILRVKQETNFGALETTGFKAVPFNTVSLKFSQNQVDSPTIAGGRSPQMKGLGNQEVSGSVEVPFDTDAMYYWLKPLFGNVATTVVGTKNQHKFTISNSCLGSLAIEKHFNGSNISYLDRGVKVNGFNFSLGEEGQINATFDLLGKVEQLIHVQSDAKNSTLTANANINATTIDVVDGTKFVAGDVITPKVAKSSIATAAVAKSSVIEVAVGEGALFVAGDFLIINGYYYMVKAISGDKLYLATQLEAAVAIADIIYVVNNSYKVVSVATNTLTITPALKNNLLLGDVIYGESSAATVNGQYFQNFEAEIVSEGETAIADIESLSFSFTNNQEGKRTIDSKGSFGRISDGTVSISCEMSLIFSVDNAEMLEKAKIGKVMDLKIRAFNANGDKFEITMPTGTLTPDSPEISSPTALSVSVVYAPFKDALTEAIELVLENEATY